MSNITVAVVCHQGLGSSLWLKVQVEKICARYHVPAHVFQADIDGITGLEPNIAVGVSYLENQLSQYADTVIVIDNILQTQELEQKLKNNKYIRPYLE